MDTSNEADMKSVYYLKQLELIREAMQNSLSYSSTTLTIDIRYETLRNIRGVKIPKDLDGLISYANGISQHCSTNYDESVVFVLALRIFRLERRRELESFEEPKPKRSHDEYSEDADVITNVVIDMLKVDDMSNPVNRYSAIKKRSIELRTLLQDKIPTTSSEFNEYAIQITSHLVCDDVEIRSMIVKVLQSMIDEIYMPGHENDVNTRYRILITSIAGSLYMPEHSINLGRNIRIVQSMIDPSHISNLMNVVCLVECAKTCKQYNYVKMILQELKDHHDHQHWYDCRQV